MHELFQPGDNKPLDPPNPEPPPQIGLQPNDELRRMQEQMRKQREDLDKEKAAPYLPFLAVLGSTLPLRCSRMLVSEEGSSNLYPVGGPDGIQPNRLVILGNERAKGEDIVGISNRLQDRHLAIFTNRQGQVFVQFLASEGNATIKPPKGSKEHPIVMNPSNRGWFLVEPGSIIRVQGLELTTEQPKEVAACQIVRRNAGNVIVRRKAGNGVVEEKVMPATGIQTFDVPLEHDASVGIGKRQLRNCSPTIEENHVQFFHGPGGIQIVDPSKEPNTEKTIVVQRHTHDGKETMVWQNQGPERSKPFTLQEGDIIYLGRKGETATERFVVEPRPSLPHERVGVPATSLPQGLMQAKTDLPPPVLAKTNERKQVFQRSASPGDQPPARDRTTPPPEVPAQPKASEAPTAGATGYREGDTVMFFDPESHRLYQKATVIVTTKDNYAIVRTGRANPVDVTQDGVFKNRLSHLLPLEQGEDKTKQNESKGLSLKDLYYDPQTRQIFSVTRDMRGTVARAELLQGLAFPRVTDVSPQGGRYPEASHHTWIAPEPRTEKEREVDRAVGRELAGVVKDGVLQHVMKGTRDHGRFDEVVGVSPLLTKDGPNPDVIEITEHGRTMRRVNPGKYIELPMPPDSVRPVYPGGKLYYCLTDDQVYELTQNLDGRTLRNDIHVLGDDALRLERQKAAWTLNRNFESKPDHIEREQNPYNKEQRIQLLEGKSIEDWTVRRISDDQGLVLVQRDGAHNLAEMTAVDITLEKVRAQDGSIDTEKYEFIDGKGVRDLAQNQRLVRDRTNNTIYTVEYKTNVDGNPILTEPTRMIRRTDLLIKTTAELNRLVSDAKDHTGRLRVEQEQQKQRAERDRPLAQRENMGYERWLKRFADGVAIATRELPRPVPGQQLTGEQLRKAGEQVSTMIRGHLRDTNSGNSSTDRVQIVFNQEVQPGFYGGKTEHYYPSETGAAEPLTYDSANDCFVYEKGNKKGQQVELSKVFQVRRIHPDALQNPLQMFHDLYLHYLWVKRNPDFRAHCRQAGNDAPMDVLILPAVSKLVAENLNERAESLSIRYRVTKTLGNVPPASDAVAPEHSPQSPKEARKQVAEAPLALHEEQWKGIRLLGTNLGQLKRVLLELNKIDNDAGFRGMLKEQVRLAKQEEQQAIEKGTKADKLAKLKSDRKALEDAEKHYDRLTPEGKERFRMEVFKITVAEMNVRQSRAEHRAAVTKQIVTGAGIAGGAILAGMIAKHLLDATKSNTDHVPTPSAPPTIKTQR